MKIIFSHIFWETLPHGQKDNTLQEIKEIEVG